MGWTTAPTGDCTFCQKLKRSAVTPHLDGDQLGSPADAEVCRNKHHCYLLAQPLDQNQQQFHNVDILKTTSISSELTHGTEESLPGNDRTGMTCQGPWNGNKSLSSLPSGFHFRGVSSHMSAMWLTAKLWWGGCSKKQGLCPLVATWASITAASADISCVFAKIN